MDIQMPVMDGYTATKGIREGGSTVPIIALTANAMKADIDKAYATGCTDFLGKPFERKAFFEKLSKYLNRSEDVLCVEDAIYPIVESADEIPLILGFVEKLPQRIIEIETALVQANWELLEMLAHRLKGAEMFGYPSLGEAAGSLEEKVVTLQHEQAIECVESLKRLCERIANGKNISHPHS